MSDKSKLSPTEMDLEALTTEPDPNNEIGSKLKAFYSSLQDEPIPERFLDLLEKLDESERNHSAGLRVSE